MSTERLSLFGIGCVLVAVLPILAAAQETAEKTVFRIKYIAQGAVYLEGGRAAGLREGQKLIVKRDVVVQPVSDSGKPSDAAASGQIAELNVISVAASSAVCEITSSTAPLVVGDLARVPAAVVAEQKKEERQQRLVAGREYPQLITFNTVDPVVEEARAAVPRPPSPDINRIRGRMGVEYSSVIGSGGLTSSEIGLVARVDMTRIGGTYWNFQGYWRGRFTTLSGSAVPATISDLINRTYTLSLQYNNPDSRLVAGGGRLYLPWATSLDTIDGGYVGRKLREHVTAGVFAGSTPDPASYDYNPNGKLAGTFLNFEGGSFDDVHYSTTFGLALGAIGWQATRQFLFSETSVSYKRKLSLYDATEIDAPHASPATPATLTTTAQQASSTGGLNRSYITLRFQPAERLELNLNDTYFRDFPTFDPLLIGTGLLDRYLFQGLSGGVRVKLPEKISAYTNLGQSSRSGDTNSSWNQMYGLTFDEVWRTGLRADLRYSKFSSAFGSGNYKAISLSHSIRESLQWDLQGGLEDFASTLTQTTQTHFINTDLDWTPGRLLFLQVGYNWQRGGTMNYDQILFMVGKRF